MITGDSKNVSAFESLLSLTGIFVRFLFHRKKDTLT